MKKIISSVFLLILMSFYIFPVTFVIFPSANTKMLMAVIGVVILIWQSFKQRDVSICKDLVVLSVLAGSVSIAGILAITINNTNDTSYVSYLISMWVWLSAAYVVCKAIQRVYIVINLEMVCKYFIAVCLLQCVLALGIEFVPLIKQFVDSIVLQGQDSLTQGGRLYGLGASLDTAGTRFAVSLVMLVYLVCKKIDVSKKDIWFYTLSYFIIIGVGNMIARTTLVGVFLSILLLLEMKWRFIFQYNRKVLTVVLISLLCVIGVGLHLYETNAEVHELFRFGFEPIFNYIEGGEFATSSSQMLKNMYVFPESIKTWIIGDGYFNNPNTHDPYYVGQSSVFGYYMGTDVGYLRLVFYFGLIGMACFVLFLVQSTRMACRSMPDDRVLFVLILLLGFIIWLKVATDLFFVIALFICIANIKPKNLITTNANNI